MATLYPSLAGRPVVITGGATGIGAAMTRAFAAQGSKVTFLDLDAEAGQTLAAATGARFQQCDLTDIPALQAALAAAAAAQGAARVLINNAARDDRHRIEDVTVADWDAKMNVNLRHQFFAAQAVAPGMAAAGGGSIINLGSISWLMGNGGYPVYVTAKAAIHGLTRGLARDLGPQKIRVNALVPGWVMTERQKALWLTPESLRAHLERQCLKETVEPEDIAAMALWLGSDESRMVTSQALIVDGGVV